MQDDAGGVEDRAQGRPVALREATPREARVAGGVERLTAIRSRFGEHGPHGVHESGTLTGVDRSGSHDRVHGRHLATRVRHAVSTANAPGRILIAISLAWITSPSISIAARCSSWISTVRALIAWMVVPL